MKIPSIRVSVVREGTAETGDARTLEEPAMVENIMRELLAGDEREHFVLFCLDGQNRLKSYSIISIGTLDASLVHPREVFRPAIVSGAAGVIIAHNHPSGELRPSPEDIETTKRLAQAGRILGLPVLDHVIVGHGKAGHYSFRREGTL